MRITCETEVLAKAMKSVATLAKAKSPIPILANVLIEASDGKVALTCANMEQQITRTITANVEGVVATTVDASRLATLAGAIAGGTQCVLEFGTDDMTMKAGRSRYKFSTLAADGFPKTPHPDNVATATVGEEMLIAMEGVRHAVAVADSKAAHLQGVWMDGDMAIASDGSRAARWTMLGANMPPVFLPTSAVDQLRRLGGECDGVIEVSVSGRAAFFDFGEARMSTKLMDLKFPVEQLGRMIDMPRPRRVEVESAALMGALSRLGVVIEDRDQTAHVTLSDNELTIRNTTGTSQGVEVVPCSYTGDGFQIGYRAGWLRQAIEALGSASVCIEMASDPNDPSRITSASRDGAVLVLMPIRI